MRQTFLLLFAALLPIVANAYDAEIDGIYYNFSGNEAVVITNGNNSYSGTVVIPTSIIYNGKTYNITCIGDSAFYDCSELTSITIPEGMTNIGTAAFSGCTSLTSVSIPNSVTNIGNSAFNSCSGLTSVTIGNSVTSISERAFIACSSLTSITIPNSVTNIGLGAFEDCI